jgi:hypothetical protein
MHRIVCAIHGEVAAPVAKIAHQIAVGELQLGQPDPLGVHPGSGWVVGHQQLERARGSCGNAIDDLAQCLLVPSCAHCWAREVPESPLIHIGHQPGSTSVELADAIRMELDLSMQLGQSVRQTAQCALADNSTSVKLGSVLIEPALRQ